MLEREDSKEQADAATGVTQPMFSREWGESKRPIGMYLLGELTIRKLIHQ